MSRPPRPVFQFFCTTLGRAIQERGPRSDGDSANSWQNSANTSLAAGMSPPTSVGGSSSRVAASARCAATLSNADHLARSACVIEDRMTAGSLCVRWWASWHRNWRDSSDHLPPTSNARTVKMHLPLPVSSGYVVLRLRLAARCMQTPGETDAWRCGRPS